MAVLKEEEKDFAADGRFYQKLENKWIIKELKSDYNGACVTNI